MTSLQPSRYLITTTLPCVDEVMGLGSLAGSLLPADVYARFLRARGEDVLFVSATDEHVPAVELAARETGLDVSDYCRRRHEAQARVAEDFGLSFDAFGRSSGPQAREQTQYFAKRLDEEGFLEARSTRRDSRHLFFLQSKLASEVRGWLSEKCDWPALALSLALEQLDEGLKDPSATRDSRWGAPVSRQGFEEKVYCAWFDAPIACIGATREWADARGEPDAWRQWWRASDQVRYVHFATEEDIPRNAVRFPCMVLGSGEKWKLVDYLKVFHGRLGAFVHRGLEPLSPDCWRYYSLANAPEVEDADFAWEAIAAVVNEDLAGNFGAFVHRTLTFGERHFGGEIPAGGQPGPPELELLEDLDRLLDAYTQRMDALEFRPAIAGLRELWSRGNAYLDRKRPWVAIEADREDAELTLRFCVNLVFLFARLSAPTIPFTANRVLDALSVPVAERGWPSTFKGDELPPAHPITVPPPLFAPVSPAVFGAPAGGHFNPGR